MKRKEVEVIITGARTNTKKRSMCKSSFSIRNTTQCFVITKFRQVDSSSMCVYRIYQGRLPMPLFFNDRQTHSRIGPSAHVIILSTIYYMNSTKTDYLANNFEVANITLTPVCGACIRMIFAAAAVAVQFLYKFAPLLFCCCSWCLVNYVAIEWRHGEVAWFQMAFTFCL